MQTIFQIARKPPQAKPSLIFPTESVARVSLARVFLNRCWATWRRSCIADMVMAIRITTLHEFRGTTIKIDGRLQAVDVDELLKELSQLANMVAIDLSDLKSADREAVGFLRELIARGVELQAATPYVKLLLETSPGAM